jgi:hypothetical protein
MDLEVIILVFIICGIVSILKVSGMSMTLKSTFSNTQQNEVKNYNAPVIMTFLFLKGHPPMKMVNMVSLTPFS